MSQAAFTLGNTPPRSREDVMTGLVRLHRLYDMEAARLQGRGRLACGHPHPDVVRVRIVDELIAWLRPTVAVERAAREAAEDRTDAEAKGQLT